MIWGYLKKLEETLQEMRWKGKGNGLWQKRQEKEKSTLWAFASRANKSPAPKIISPHFGTFGLFWAENCTVMQPKLIVYFICIKRLLSCPYYVLMSWLQSYLFSVSLKSNVYNSSAFVLKTCVRSLVIQTKILLSMTGSAVHCGHMLTQRFIMKLY